MVDEHSTREPQDPPPASVVAVPGGTRARAEEWALVLASQGIVCRIRADDTGFVLDLDPEQLAAAGVVLARYQRENRPPPERPEPETPPGTGGTGPAAVGLGLALALIAVFAHTGDRESGDLLFARGSAAAERILAGEWWRAVTALCLHADLGHVLSNALACLYFVPAVCRSLGLGVGPALILVSGALGNLANALLHLRSHDSVGASTAVFGAIGLLAGVAVLRRRRDGLRRGRVVVPVAAGLGLLAMLGTSGARVDIWAHALGLVAGFGLAFVPARARPGASAPPARVEILAAAASVLLLAFAWSLALR
jgi:membrane associated rhomboid family serine protease